MLNLFEKYPPLDFNYFINICKEYDTYDEEQKKIFINKVVKVHPLLTYDIYSPAYFFRVRKITNQEIKYLSDVLWPPPAIGMNTRFGNICYMANSDKAAFKETGIVDGDIAILVRFRIIPGVKLRTLPIGDTDMIARSGVGYTTNYESVKKIDNLLHSLSIIDYYKTLTFLMQDSFIFEQLTSTNWNISKYTINCILQKQNDPLDVISYPSTKYRGGLNFGVIPHKFGSQWVIAGISKVRVNVLPYGYYDINFLEHVIDINNAERLIWEKHDERNGKKWRPLHTIL